MLAYKGIAGLTQEFGREVFRELLGGSDPEKR